MLRCGATQIRKSLARTLGALMVGVYLVAGGPILANAWRTGAHATPEQWAFHQQMEQRGIPRHHGPAPVDDGSARSAPEQPTPAVSAGASYTGLAGPAMQAAPPPTLGSSLEVLTASHAVPREPLRLSAEGIAWPWENRTPPEDLAQHPTSPPPEPGS